MRKAKEDEYFEKKNKEALMRLAEKSKDKPRLSPVTGQPMEQIVINGVVVDRCPTSKGIWLDAGELEQLINASMAKSEEANTWLSGLFSSLKGK